MPRSDHNGHWPVGVASVVLAKDKRQGKKLLDAALVEAGLLPFKLCKYTLTKIPMIPHAKILNDGDY